MKYDPQMIAQVIGILRIQHGCTQKEVAAKAGLSRSHYAAVESGKKTANVDTICRIASAFGLLTSEFFRIVEIHMHIASPERKGKMESDLFR